MSFILSVLLYFYSFSENSAHAEFDLSVGGYSRSYPLGGSAELNMGYSLVLWGQSASPFLGYIRLATDIEGVVDYFSSTAKIEIFPVSFLGVRAGQAFSQSHLDFDEFDCEVFLCRGKFTENFYEVPLFLAYSDFIFSSSYRVGNWRSDKDNMSALKTEFIDPTSGLNLNISDQDTVKRARAILMYNLSENFRLGYSETYYWADDLPEAMQGSQQVGRESHLWLGFLQYNLNDLSLMVGAGEYKSHLLPTDPTVIVSLNYSFIKILERRP